MSLANRLQVKQVAWNFSGSTRVFNVGQITVRATELRRNYETANNAKVFDYKGIWLFFTIQSQYFKEQVSGTSTDRIDILNALKSTTVLFYPDYIGSPSTSYEVISNDRSTTLLQTNRSLFAPSFNLNMQAVDLVTNYPAWLEYR